MAKQAFRIGRGAPISTRQLVVAAVTMVGAAIMLAPIVLMVNAAVRPITEILAYPPKLIPEQITLEHFANVVSDEENQRHFANSSILAFSSLIVSVGLGYLAAYAFSRFRLRGGRAMLLGILGILMIPRILLIIPYFRLAAAFHVRDTIPGLVMVNAAFTMPIAIWLLKGYIDSIPVELEEAAMIDGCSRLQAVWRVLIPISVPGIVGIGTFVFVAAWHEYILAIILTDTPATQPLTIALAKFFGYVARDWNSIMALSTIASLPLALIFVIFQRYVVQGMTSGAVK